MPAPAAFLDELEPLPEIAVEDIDEVQPTSVLAMIGVDEDGALIVESGLVEPVALLELEPGSGYPLNADGIPAEPDVAPPSRSPRISPRQKGFPGSGRRRSSGRRRACRRRRGRRRWPRTRLPPASPRGAARPKRPGLSKSRMRLSPADELEMLVEPEPEPEPKPEPEPEPIAAGGRAGDAGRIHPRASGRGRPRQSSRCPNSNRLTPAAAPRELGRAGHSQGRPAAAGARATSSNPRLLPSGATAGRRCWA